MIRSQIEEQRPLKYIGEIKETHRKGGVVLYNGESGSLGDVGK